MIPDAAVEVGAKMSYYIETGKQWEAIAPEQQGELLSKTYSILEAAAPHMLGGGSAQALEDALIDFGRESVYLTTSQETMARFLRERAAELRPQ